MNWEEIGNLFDFYCLSGASKQEIEMMEERLSLKFSSEFREMLTLFGVVSVNNHEIVGFSKSKRLDVVAVTKEKRLFAIVPEDFYVIEDLCIDDVVIWQNAKGTIFQTVGRSLPSVVAGSLIEYLGI